MFKKSLSINQLVYALRIIISLILLGIVLFALLSDVLLYFKPAASASHSTFDSYPKVSGTTLAQIQAVLPNQAQARSVQICNAPDIVAPPHSPVVYSGILQTLLFKDHPRIVDMRHPVAQVITEQDLQPGQIIRITVDTNQQLRIPEISATKIEILGENPLPTVPQCIAPSIGSHGNRARMSSL